MTRIYKGLQEVTGDDRGLQGVTGGFLEATMGGRELKGVRVCYKGFQGV